MIFRAQNSTRRPDYSLTRCRDWKTRRDSENSRCPLRQAFTTKAAAPQMVPTRLGNTGTLRRVRRYFHCHHFSWRGTAQVSGETVARL